MKSLFTQFEVIEDPRDTRGKRHELINILIMTIYGILLKHTDFTNIAYFLKVNEDYFIELLKLENGVPSHDCLSDVFAVIEPKKFMEIFIDWTKELVENKTGKIINIDGKAVRSATDKINGGNTPYIVSAFLGEVGLSIGEVKVDDKSNEITAIPELLDLLDIEGATITIDAIGTQEKIVKKIVKKGGHYVLPVKKNQKELLSDIKRCFNKINNLKGHNEIRYKTSYEKDHNRIEKREYYIKDDVSTIKDKDKWDTVKSIAYVKITVIQGEESKVTDKYYIMDQALNADRFEQIVRNHWQIETALHWRLDVILDEDHSRNRVGNSINNLSIIRKIVFNLASLDKSFGDKLPLQRKLTNYQADFKNIENLIFNVIPSIV
jgi:predicted transposase YbfD/YdcC